MHPGTYALSSDDKPAVVMAGRGTITTYGELDDRANQTAQLFWERGLRPGDHVALFMENHPRYFEVYWAAIRSGLYLTTVNRYLTGEEAGLHRGRLRGRRRRDLECACGRGGRDARRRSHLPASLDGRRCLSRVRALRGGNRGLID